jgi:hypothetical protein
MPLTSRDETDLIMPLFGGMHENPRFSTFLARLQRRTDAAYVSLILRPGRASGSIVEYFHGIDLRRRALELGAGEPYDLDRVHYDSLRPGRVYSISQLVEHDPVARVERARRLGSLGISDERVVRIADNEKFSAWLVLVRVGPCTAADSALLSNLTPYVGIAVDNLVTIEGEQQRSRINALALAHTRRSLMAFDREGRLMVIDPAAANLWKDRSGAEPRIGERLVGVDVGAQRQLVAAAAEMAENRRVAARPIVLRENPRVEALLIPVGTEPAQTLDGAALLALLPSDLPRAPNGSARLASAFNLPLREAGNGAGGWAFHCGSRSSHGPQPGDGTQLLKKALRQAQHTRPGRTGAPGL